MSPRIWFALPLLLANWACGAMSGAPDAHARDGSLVSGDLIVRFHAATEPGAVVGRAMQQGDVPGPELQGLAASLSSGLGVPVTPVRVTSGAEVVLRVDRDALLRALQSRVAGHAAVRAFTPLAPAGTILPTDAVGITLELDPGSEPARIVAEVRSGPDADGAGDERLADLVQRFGGTLYPRPQGRIDAQGRLVLSLDLAALTLDLIDRLKQRAEVEYAQPSRILRPLRAPAP